MELIGKKGSWFWQILGAKVLLHPQTRQKHTETTNRLGFTFIGVSLDANPTHAGPVNVRVIMLPFRYVPMTDEKTLNAIIAADTDKQVCLLFTERTSPNGFQAVMHSWAVAEALPQDSKITQAIFAAFNIIHVVGCHENGPLSWTCVSCVRVSDTRLPHCKECGVVRYCDAKCQRDDWSRHRALCPLMLEVIAYK